MTFHISADTGGTFIDVVINDAAGVKTIGKSLTTHARVFEGLERAVAAAAGEIGMTSEELFAQTSLFIYGDAMPPMRPALRPAHGLGLRSTWRRSRVTTPRRWETIARTSSLS